MPSFAENFEQRYRIIEKIFAVFAFKLSTVKKIKITTKTKYNNGY
jgi:hypothetical protein